MRESADLDSVREIAAQVWALAHDPVWLANTVLLLLCLLLLTWAGHWWWGFESQQRRSAEYESLLRRYHALAEYERLFGREE